MIGKSLKKYITLFHFIFITTCTQNVCLYRIDADAMPTPRSITPLMRRFT